MKSLIFLIIILLPVSLIAGEFPQFAPIAWMCGENTNLHFSASDIRGAADHRVNFGFGFSMRAAAAIFDTYLDIGGYVTGYNFTKWEIDMNLSRNVLWGIHLFGGGNYTGWSLESNNPEAKADFGYQVGFERKLITDDAAMLILQFGYKYNAGQLKHTDVDIKSDAIFSRIGVLMDFGN